MQLLDKLKTTFAPTTDTAHWFAVKCLMQSQIGSTIETVVNQQDGMVTAFFTDHVLTGKKKRVSAHYNDISGKTTFVLEMPEPTGHGKSPEEAVLALWQHMKSIPGDQYILRHEGIMNADNPEHAKILKGLKKETFGMVSRLTYSAYTHFKYDGGRFINLGLTYLAPPTDRKTNQHQPSDGNAVAMDRAPA